MKAEKVCKELRTALEAVGWKYTFDGSSAVTLSYTAEQNAPDVEIYITVSQEFEEMWVQTVFPMNFNYKELDGVLLSNVLNLDTNGGLGCFSLDEIDDEMRIVGRQSYFFTGSKRNATFYNDIVLKNIELICETYYGPLQKFMQGKFDIFGFQDALKNG